MALASIGVFVAGAIVSGVVLHDRITRETDTVRLLQTEGRAVEARVVTIERRRGEGNRTILRYSYVVDGREYTGSTKLNKRDRTRFTSGSAVFVRYLASRPESSWVQDYGPGATPAWLVAAVPAAILLCIIPIVMFIMRQVTLLSEGRAALARVTNTRKVSHGEHSAWRIEYELTLLSGARRLGRYDQHSRPPAIGAMIPVVYDRDNPKRIAPYPFSLVRVEERRA